MSRSRTSRDELIDRVTCPQCRHAFPLTRAVIEEVKHRFEKEKQLWLQKERQEIEKRAEHQVAERLNSTLEDLHEALREKDKALVTARKHEFALRKRQRELEEKEATVQLNAQRAIDQERTKITEQITKRLEEQTRLTTLEKQKQLDDLKKQIHDLKRKTEASCSQELQGSVQEKYLYDILKTAFPHDSVNRIGKGKRGADVLLTVRDSSGKHAGKILFESKRTKAFHMAWLRKLRIDAVNERADVAALVSEILPSHLNAVTQKDGVWLCDLHFALALTTILRSAMLKIHNERSAKPINSDALSVYITSATFLSHVKSIVEAFTSMQKDLNAEKLAMAALHAKREAQILLGMQTMARMYGELKGITRNALPDVQSLVLLSK